MKYPSPQDLGAAPAWENYVIVQTVSACRGQVPVHAVALGVEVRDACLSVHFQLTEITDDDKADVDDIVSELEALMGPDVNVEALWAVVEARKVLPTDGVSWIYLSREE